MITYIMVKFNKINVLHIEHLQSVTVENLKHSITLKKIFLLSGSPPCLRIPVLNKA